MCPAYSSARMRAGVCLSSPPEPRCLLMPFLAQPSFLHKLGSPPPPPHHQGHTLQGRYQISLLLTGSGITLLVTGVMIFIKPLTSREQPPCALLRAGPVWEQDTEPSNLAQFPQESNRLFRWAPGSVVACGTFLSSWESIRVLHVRRKRNLAPGHVLWCSRERWRLGVQ